MLVLYLLVLLVGLFGLKIRRHPTLNEALSIEQCNAIKGISILLVFISHANQYISSGGYQYSMIGDDIFLHIKSFIGQLCVVMFFFYSGYGIEWSILSKGKRYTQSMPRRRILSTLINFDIAVIVFFIINLLLGDNFSLPNTFLSLLAWDSIGNSNWYIFDILILYAFSYISALVFVSSRNRFYMIVTMIILLIMVLHMFKDSWWYDTLLAYPAGIYVAMNKDRIGRLMKNNYWTLLFSLLVCLWVLKSIGSPHVIVYNAASVAFAFLVVLLTFKVRIQNRFLIWYGVQLFPLYIYQRLPMMVMKELSPSFIASQPIVFCVSSLVITTLVAYFYHYCKVIIR